MRPGSNRAERLACSGGGLVFLGKVKHVSGHLLTKALGAEWQTAIPALFHQNGAVCGYTFLTVDPVPILRVSDFLADNMSFSALIS